MGEITYSVRSVRRFAPWIRNVRIVVKPGQKPPVDLDDPSIHLVEEPEILPAEIRPTFASPSIDLFVHHIPGLSEVFIYANDDFLCWRPSQRPELPLARSAAWPTATNNTDQRTMSIWKST